MAALSAFRSASMAWLSRAASERAGPSEAGQPRTHSAGTSSAKRASYSEAFGGGPVWTRSPTYAPMSVKRTPSADSKTYMKAGMVFTVWLE